MKEKQQGKEEHMFPMPSTTQFMFSSLRQELNFHRQSQPRDRQHLTECYKKHWLHMDAGCAIHSFSTFSGTTVPLLSEEDAPSCKTEPTLLHYGLSVNLTYHSLQCIILKHISKLLS